MRSFLGSCEVKGFRLSCHNKNKNPVFCGACKHTHTHRHRHTWATNKDHGCESNLVLKVARNAWHFSTYSAPLFPILQQTGFFCNAWTWQDLVVCRYMQRTPNAEREWISFPVPSWLGRISVLLPSFRKVYKVRFVQFAGLPLFESLVTATCCTQTGMVAGEFWIFGCLGDPKSQTL